MRYGEWLAQVPDSLKNDPIWKFKAYPKALLLIIALLVTTIKRCRTRTRK